MVKEYQKNEIKNIVFVNDLNDNENQEQLSMKVKAFQEIFKAKLHILFVNTPGDFVSDTITLSRLKEFADKFAFKNYTLNIFSEQDKEEGIIHFTKSVKGDLIAMATHGKKGISRFLNGSLTEVVVNHANCLVWTYKLNHKVSKTESIQTEYKEEAEIELV